MMGLSDSKGEKQFYLSLARVICAIAVIMIHTNTCFNEFNLNSCWESAVVIDCGLGVAVPIFIMISGATLIDYSERYSTKEYFIKRIKKTVLPCVIWNIIGTFFAMITGEYGYFFIYYFFWNLFGVYLCIPLFSFIQKEYRITVCQYVVGISFFINYLLPFASSVLSIDYIYKLPFEIGSNFIIYALIGYLISKKDLPVFIRVFSYIGSLLGFILHIAGTYYSSVDAGYIVHTYRGYTNLPCLLSAIGVFVFIKQIGNSITSKSMQNAIEWLSKQTFAVYLIHFYVIYFILNLFSLNMHSFMLRIFVPFVIFLICVLLSWIIKKVPYINKILP